MNLDLGKRIATLRKANKVTQSELAEYLAVQPQTISRWEAEGGMPDISLLPRIAVFFGITLDELFGMTDMERINNLVCKYSVMRDEKSFKEAMRSLEQGIAELKEAENKYGSKVSEKDAKGEICEATAMRRQLTAWKVHMYIQKSRQAIGEAEQILDELMSEVTDPRDELYLSLRLQKQQFRIHGGQGSATVRAAKETWERSSSLENLYCYMAALVDMDNGEKLLELWETEEVQRQVLDTPECVVSHWLFLFYAARQEKRLDVFEKYFPVFEENKETISKRRGDAIFSARWDLTETYKALGMEEKVAQCKQILLEEVKKIPVNEVMRQEYLRRIMLL